MKKVALNLVRTAGFLDWVKISGVFTCLLLTLLQCLTLGRPFPHFFMFLFIAACLVFLWEECGSIKEKPRALREILFFICTIATISTWYIYSVPFQIWGDLVRDIGLSARSMIDYGGDSWSNGPYNGFVHMLTFIFTPFEWLYPNSIKSMRTSGLFFGLLSFYMQYLLFKRIIGRNWALLCSAIISASPIFIFYQRAHVVVLFNIAFTALGACWLLENRRHPWSAAISFRRGFLLGVSTYFHMALPFMLLCCWFSIACVDGIKSIKSRRFKNFMASQGIAFLACMIAMAPRGMDLIAWIGAILWRASPSAVSGDASAILNLAGLSLQRLLVADTFSGMLAPPFSISAIGSCVLLWTGAALFISTLVWSTQNYKLQALKIILTLALVCITNSAITNAPYSAHRMCVAIVLLSLIICLGMKRLCLILRSTLPKKVSKNVFIVLFIASSLVTFYKGFEFIEKLRKYEIDPERTTQTGDIASALSSFFMGGRLKGLKQVCISSGNKDTAYEFGLMHFREQIDYYTGATRQYETKLLENTEPAIVHIGKECSIPPGSKLVKFRTRLISIDPEFVGLINREEEERLILSGIAGNS